MINPLIEHTHTYDGTAYFSEQDYQIFFPLNSVIKSSFLWTELLYLFF